MEPIIQKGSVKTIRWHKVILMTIFLVILLGVSGFIGYGLGYVSNVQVDNTVRSITPTPTPTIQNRSDKNGYGLNIKLDKSIYSPNDKILVTVDSEMVDAISVSDHNFECSIFTLQKYVDNEWKDVSEGNCTLGRVTESILIKSKTQYNSTLTAYFTYPDKGALTSGIYSLKMGYRVGSLNSNTTFLAGYSPNFEVKGVYVSPTLTPTNSVSPTATTGTITPTRVHIP